MSVVFNPTLLSVDSVGQSLQVSLLHQSVCHQRIVPSEKHANKITDIITDVCASSGVGLKDCDYLVVNIGPGPFTGLRVGLSCVRALGHALGTPIIAFSHTEILAYDAFFFGSCSLSEPSYFATLVDARLAQVYFSVYALSVDRILVPYIADTLYRYADLPDCSECTALVRSGPDWVTLSEHLSTHWQKQSDAITHYPTLPEAATAILTDAPSSQETTMRSRATCMLHMVRYLHRHQKLNPMTAQSLKPLYVRHEVAKKPPKPQVLR